MLIDARHAVLMVIDVQDRLNPVMDAPERVIANVSRLMKAAAVVGVPVLASEQYPRGLGHTVAPLAELMPAGAVVEKMAFSCMADETYRRRFDALNRSQAVICGIEAHVCVLQTAMELLDRDIKVFVVDDGTSSRTPENHNAALFRLGNAGAEIVTTEMVLFEWLRRAGTAEFKSISQLVK